MFVWVMPSYTKCRYPKDALSSRFKFNMMSIIVAWNATILGYVECWQGHKALELYA
jgi:hypothetical protein